MVTNADIQLVLASGSPQPNQANLDSLSADVEAYVNNRGIGGSIYFSEIASLAITYGLVPVGLKLNTVDGNFFTAASDEIYKFQSFII